MFSACGAMLNMLAGRMREKNRRELKQELEKESIDVERDKAEMERLIKLLKLRIDILQRMI